MFPSCSNHANINPVRTSEILQTMLWNSFDQLQLQQVDDFIDRFGTVHSKASFVPNYPKPEGYKRNDVFHIRSTKNGRTSWRDREQQSLH